MAKRARGEGCDGVEGRDRRYKDSRDEFYISTQEVGNMIWYSMIWYDVVM